MSDVKSRKWQGTANNPLAVGLTHSKIIEILSTLPTTYFCMADEIANTGTPHTHFFLYAPDTVRFNTLKNKFPTVHFDKAYGTCAQNRDYISKTGKWAASDKANTVVPGTFYEWGTMPAEGVEKSPKNAKLLELIKDGKTTAQILEENPNYLFRATDIDKVRQTFLAEKYSEVNRVLSVSYLYGATGTGKTRSIFSVHGAKNICRITHYDRDGIPRFDAYNAHDVLVFEEYDSQVPITAMLNFLDIYPLMLPARYADKVACYTKVYLTSNIPLQLQYLWVQQNQPETWQAFLRRIHHITEFTANGTTITHK